MANAFSSLQKTLRQVRIPRLAHILRLPSVLTPQERLVFAGGLLAVLIGVTAIGAGWYLDVTEPIPTSGGTYIEGLIGEPRFVNPLFAPTNDVDADLARLLYAGLLRVDTNGGLVPDLAERYDIATDGKSVTVHLRPGLRWHDGAELTADDVVFTMHLIQDANAGSPLRGSFRGVTVERMGEGTVRFSTDRPLAVFLSALTVGILPEHLWIDIPPGHLPLAELNVRPIGTGPYQFVELTKDRKGTIRSYTLARYANYHQMPAAIERMTFRFFTDTEELVRAFNGREIDGMGTLLTLTSGQITRSDVAEFPVHLPQTTAVFLNPKRNESLKELTVRRALSQAINRQTIIDTAFRGSGRPIGGPIVPGFDDVAAPPDPDTYDRDTAATALDAAQWVRVDPDAYRTARTKTKLIALEVAKKQAGKKKAELSATEDERAAVHADVEQELDPEQPYYRLKSGEALAIIVTTPDAPELVAAANAIRDAWRAIGVRTIVESIPLERVRGDIIPSRNYDALLFSQILSSDPDPFPFWHSSQVRHPGLNLTYFSDRAIDTILEQARTTFDRAARGLQYAEFQQRLATERPAIFLATPTLTYAIANAVHGVTIGALTQPADRFASVTDWYTETERVWKSRSGSRTATEPENN